MRRVSLLLFIVTLLSGCQIYFGGDDDCVNGSGSGSGPPRPLPVGLRNPATGQCEYHGGGGGGGGDNCGDYRPPMASGDSAGAPFMADWATCESPCSAFNEASCQAADGCRAVYLDGCNGAQPCNVASFFDCWATAPSGPVRGGECSGLDAQTCSQHDDCSAVHRVGICEGGDCLAVGDFAACRNETQQPPPACSTLAEPGCIARADCAPLYQGSDCSCTPAGCHCNQQTFVSCTGGGDGGGGACGPYTCSSDEYCQHGTGGAAPGVNTYACKPMPSTCSAGASCMCLQGEPCGYQCSQDAASGGFTLTCLYP